MDRSRLGIVIPALNEAATIARVVTGAACYGRPIVVDDGSTDDTATVAATSGADVVRLPVNQGYDCALNAGFVRAYALGCEAVLTMDADGQHADEAITSFLAALERGAELVVGVRDRKARFAEHLFGVVGAWRFGLHDPQCGMKAYRLSLWRARGWFDSYGSIGTELALFGAASGVRVAEVPVPTRAREGAPRFGRVASANLRILRALCLGCWCYGWRVPRRGSK
jgi:glycosyltransferase involved in cell wall biosynthesis